MRLTERALAEKIVNAYLPTDDVARYGLIESIVTALREGREAQQEMDAQICDDLRAARPTTERGLLIATECAVAIRGQPEGSRKMTNHPLTEAALVEIEERWANFVTFRQDPLITSARRAVDIDALLGHIRWLEEQRSADCVCGDNGNAHREEKGTGAARECTKCDCAQFFNVHMALTTANERIAVLEGENKRLERERNFETEEPCET